METLLQSVVGPGIVAGLALVGVLAARRDAKGALTRARETPQGISTQDQATIAGLVTALGHLSERVEHLEERTDKAERLSRSFAGYVARLLDYIAHHLPGRTDVPEPPADVAENLPR